MGSEKVNESMPIGLKKLFGGIPFISEHFRISSFLTAVACARQHRGNLVDFQLNSLAEYLNEENAVKVYNLLLGRSLDMKGESISMIEKSKIGVSIKEIAELSPGWELYFSLPVVTRKISQNVFGFSNASIPQHIFLNCKVWDCGDELREQYLHEFAHIWFYMINELWVFHKDDAKEHLLPSGSAMKSPTGVLNALFVALVLSKFYVGAGESWVERKEKLLNYVDDCVVLLLPSTELTEIGREFLDICTIEVRNLKSC